MKVSYLLHVFIIFFISVFTHNVKGKDSIIESNLVKITLKYTEESELDIYYDNEKIDIKRPVIIHVHGGGWAEGSKDKEAYMGEFFQKKDFVSVLINYRLYSEINELDDMVEDVYKAIQWVVNNINQYGGDSEQITLIGHSAGANLNTLTMVKAALNMMVNGVQLQPFHLKHIISLNGHYEIENDSELSVKINVLKVAGVIPGLGFLKDYGKAREKLLVGKENDSNDQCKILKGMNDKSIIFLGADKYTFVECNFDVVVPYGTAKPMIEQLERTVEQIIIDHKVYPGGHNYILDGIKNKNSKIENELLSIVESVY
ncbi:alpha/beta-hydrolase [Piromyces finnis]|uniref:Alpha/beta-hydrolase n=1 Tax=Piromyces finnis TaxID=1754191 RepID=A0A1Y1VLH8_9FUNG|nr:alpha/beta-hydrolase [Piromyces finnis]|eukprot:ORX59318.1 alpha/beta-hydrolase [Piromyces finnis]